MAGTFRIGGIPNLSIWEGETLTFTVTTKLGKGAKFSKRAKPAPKGTMEIDAATGVFSYSPAAADTEDIEIWIQAEKGGADDKQKVVLTPHPRIPSDFNIISHTGAPPDPSSQIYTTISGQKNPDKERFNNTVDFDKDKEDTVKIETRQVSISGVQLVFRQNNASYPLFDRLHKKTDVTRLTLCADEVVVGSPLELPGTDVYIHARRLVFEGDGAIVTTPLSIVDRAKKDDATPGQRAGDVYLYVRDLENSGSARRIVAKGGTGQPARLGSAGKPGDRLNTWGGHAETPRVFGSAIGLDWPTSYDGYAPVYAEIWSYYERKGTNRNVGKHENYHFEFPQGEKKWPTDGKPPEIQPGSPGQGGNGGSVFSPFAPQLQNRVQLDCGSVGEAAKKIDAAKAGTPTRSCHVKVVFDQAAWPFENKKKEHRVLERRETKDGPAAEAPGPRGRKAENGSLSALSVTKTGYWLHPAAVRAFVPYVHDAMLAGHSGKVRSILADYASTIQNALKPNGALDHSIEWSGLHAELTALLLRIDSPNDYFGNPPGWVPMLSFDTNLELYKGEIDSAIRTMFLTYWVEKTQQRGQAAAAVLKDALSRSQKESDRALADYDAAQKKLGQLDEQCKAITADLEKAQSALKVRERDLQRVVKDDLQREHTLRSAAKVLGGVMQLVPLGQPVLGAFGKGMTALSEIDLEKPVSTLPKVAGAFAPLAKEKLVPKVTALFEKLKEAKTESEEEDKQKPDADKEKFDAAVAKKKLAAKVKKYMDDQKEAEEEVMKGFSNFAVPEDEIKERLAKVLADCPAYQENIKEIEALNTQKAAFAGSMLATMRTINESSLVLLKNQLGRIEMRSQLDASIEQLSTEVLQYAQGLSQRARERLLTYQYYVLKSYHYMMLDEFRGMDFRADKLAGEFAKLLGGSKDGTLTSEQYKTLLPVFEDPLRTMVKQIVDRYEGHPLATSGSLFYALSKEQLETLNSPAGTITLDLMQTGHLNLIQEGIRIDGINISDQDGVAIANPPKQGQAITINLDYRHEGISRLRSGGRLFLFRSGNYRATSNGIEYLDDQSYWGTNVMHDGKKMTIKERKPDQADTTLIKHLSGKENIDPKAKLNYRPSAWADLTIRRTTTPSTYTAKLESLILEVKYVSDNVHRDLRTVLVKMPDDLEAFVQCDTLDVNGRTHGQGTFLRTFDSTKIRTVQLTAPARFGSRTFLGWKLGQETIATPVLKLQMSKQMEFTVEPLYSPLVVPAPDDKSKLWPACPAGWKFTDWMVVNKSETPVTFTKIDFTPWSGHGYPPRVNDPQGNEQVKLSFDSVVLVEDEAARISVCTNPAVEGKDGHQIGFEWQTAAGTHALFFTGKGEAVGVLSWADGKWNGVTEGYELDKEDRTLTFVQKQKARAQAN